MPHKTKFLENLLLIPTHERHSHSTRVACQVCSKDFSSISYLRVHVKEAHERSFTVFCPDCGRGFFQGSRMRSHQEQVHPSGGPWPCPDCNRVFKSGKKLQQHSRLHTGLGLEDCQFCDKSFTSKHRLA